MDSSVGIRGVALYLPPIVRRNDWWPSEVVARWKTDAEARQSAPLAHPRSLGTARVLAALVEQAVVVGRVSGRRGIRGSSHHADGRYPNTMMARYPSAVSSERDPGMIYVADAAWMRDVFLQTADVCKESIETVLASTHHPASDIGFFAMYQGTPWLRRVVQDYVGFQHARSIDTFARTGYLFAATLPAGLALAEQAGLLRPDDLVMVTGGGTGMTFGSILVRWGS